ncbi:MAG: hypothetical protein WCD76_06190 [Pyrinomonadaceae bacterium]
MSIANELCSDIATALLVSKESGAQVNSEELREIVVRVHSTLRHLTATARRTQRRWMSSSAALPPPNISAASDKN